jgi:hypothetical protein
MVKHLYIRWPQDRYRIWPFNLLNASNQSDFLSDGHSAFKYTYFTGLQCANYVKKCNKDIALVFMKVMLGQPTRAPMYNDDITHANLLMFDCVNKVTVLFEPVKHPQLPTPFTLPVEVPITVRALPADWPRAVHVKRGVQDLTSKNRMECLHFCWYEVEKIHQSGFPDTAGMQVITV